MCTVTAILLMSLAATTVIAASHMEKSSFETSKILLWRFVASPYYHCYGSAPHDAIVFVPAAYVGALLQLDTGIGIENHNFSHLLY
jgi:hypothetical protein